MVMQEVFTKKDGGGLRVDFYKGAYIIQRIYFFYRG
jgi:hypothetical protein